MLMVILLSAFFIPVYVSATEKEKCKVHTVHEIQKIRTSPREINIENLYKNKDYQCMPGFLRVAATQNMLQLTFSRPKKVIYFVLKDAAQMPLSQWFVNKPVHYYYCSKTGLGFLKCLEKIWDTLECYAITKAL